MASFTSPNQKLALVIGINNYPGDDKLNYCINDAKDVGNMLGTIRFDVTQEMDCNKDEFNRLIDEFVSKIKPGDIVLFYFAGHDCCRIYVRSRATNSRQGLAGIRGPPESLISFSCGFNQGAIDDTKNDRNGIFTEHLLKYLTMPNQDIETILQMAARDIQSSGFPIPWRASCLTKKIYLALESDENYSELITSTIPSMTIPFNIFRGLAALGGTILPWTKYRKQSIITSYDLIVSIDSILALQTCGWKVIVGQNMVDNTRKPSAYNEYRGVVAAFFGSYNCVKTFVLSQILDFTLPSSNLIHTSGISLIEGREQLKNIIFIDTAGGGAPIPRDKLDDMKATEFLLNKIALYLCSHIIIVVNHLRATDQSYIHQMIMRSNKEYPKRNIMIIHNLMDVETVEEINYTIRHEIECIFNAKPETMCMRCMENYTYIHFFMSTHGGLNLHHFIFAKNGSDAAKIWNTQSIVGIKNILLAATQCRRNIDIVKEIIQCVNRILPQLFIHNPQQDESSNENTTQMFQVGMHAMKLYIVLSHRKELEDLWQNPYQLTLLPTFVYNDANYFMDINWINNEQWQPCYDLYETDNEIHIRVDAAGVEKNEVYVQVFEKGIIIKGCRANFKELLINPIVHRNMIPTGPFKLEISLRCHVDPETSKLERNKGFLDIICPKKKRIIELN